MDLNLTGARCLITGSSRGIGRAIAEVLLREGARVGITGRHQDALNAARLELEKEFGGDNLRSYRADMSDRSSIEQVIRSCCDDLGGIDIAIANVGPASRPDGAGDWESLLQANLMSAVHLIDICMPRLEITKGSIVVISSIAGLEALGAPAPYVAAKLGLLGLVKEVARSSASKGVRVNAVAPGNVLTAGGNWEAKLSRDRNAVMTYIEGQVPMKRFGTPIEIANAVAFLASPVSSFTTGACLTVDGGQTRRII
jgi:3-oxoacyl-[acyl-carrier protein] reductase